MKRRNWASWVLRMVADGVESPGLLLLRLRNPRLVSFKLARSLEIFAVGAGRSIRTIIDVGANEGQFAFMARKAWPDAVIYSFEPYLPAVREFQRVHANDSLVRLEAVGLGSCNSTRMLHIAEVTANNSLLPQQAGRTGRTETVQVRRLDDVCPPISNDTLVKIDVQGSELDVIAGAVGTFKRARFVLMEVSLVAQNEGAPELDLVWRVMRELCFKYVDILDVYDCRCSGAVQQMDVLFERVN